MKPTIHELSAEHVFIKNKENVLHKIELLIKGGHKKLQVISDYDMTLTKQHDNGKKHLSSFGILRVCPSIPQWYRDAEQEICDKYRPKEFDPFISREEKFKYMEEWWSASEKLLKRLTLSPQEIEDTVRKYTQNLRNGTHDMFKELNKLQVPVLVFSAGLGDTVQTTLKINDVLYPNVKVISNFLSFDNDYNVLGYTKRAIHVLNKNEQVIKDTEYYDLVKNRENVILMGDHLGDAEMANGLPHGTVLKIGFLYERVDEHLQDYMNAFDIVLVDDQTMNVVRAILNPILLNTI